MNKNYISLPILLDFTDYHDIEYFECQLKKYCKQLKAKEINPENYGYYFNTEDYSGWRTYWSIFYIGKLPLEKDIKKLFNKAFKDRPEWYK